MVVLTLVEGPANVVTPSPHRTLANDGLAMEYETREAGGRLLATTERDLQRIVLDMHDGPVQDLFAALSQLQVLERSVTDAAGQRRVRQAVGLLERALGEIRSFIGAFRPPGFERRSLGALIEGLAVQHETLTGQAVELALPGSLGDCALSAKIAVYRILQEALANGHRHSGATHQAVTVSVQGGSLVLTVSDDGRGFDPEMVLAREADVGVEGGHFGLRGIQDRVAMFGGTFAVQSAPGRGTKLTITLPAA
jgi:signal transduction histidine kinase